MIPTKEEVMRDREAVCDRIREALLGTLYYMNYSTLAWAISDEVGELYDYKAEKDEATEAIALVDDLFEYFDNYFNEAGEIFNCEQCGWWYETYEMSDCEDGMICVECHSENEED